VYCLFGHAHLVRLFGFGIEPVFTDFKAIPQKMWSKVNARMSFISEDVKYKPNGQRYFYLTVRFL